VNTLVTEETPNIAGRCQRSASRSMTAKGLAVYVAADTARVGAAL
jgi:hypothetical protein